MLAGAGHLGMPLMYQTLNNRKLVEMPVTAAAKNRTSWRLLGRAGLGRPNIRNPRNGSSSCQAMTMSGKANVGQDISGIAAPLAKTRHSNSLCFPAGDARKDADGRAAEHDEQSL